MGSSSHEKRLALTSWVVVRVNKTINHLVSGISVISAIVKITKNIFKNLMYIQQSNTCQKYKKEAISQMPSQPIECNVPSIRAADNI